MTIDELAPWVRAELAAAVDQDFRRGQYRFFQEKVDNYGVRGHQVKRIAAESYRRVKAWPAADRNKLCEALWKSGKLEEGVVAIYLYRRFQRQCGAAEFKIFARWIDRYVRNWAHTDGVASWLLAASIANAPELIEQLSAWTRSANRWKRRAAAVALLQEAKHGRRTEEIFHIAALLVEDPDDMVQKGVGWLLKETYPKKPRETVEFLATWKRRTTRLVLRYAAEKMSAIDRAAVLG
jgi:3-methyladenine DNA glycosylase AlkD